MRDGFLRVGECLFRYAEKVRDFRMTKIHLRSRLMRALFLDALAGRAAASAATSRRKGIERCNVP